MSLSPKAMMELIVRNLPQKTGKSLDQWVEIVKRSAPASPKEKVDWLKATHGLGHITAQIIASTAEGDAEEYDNPEQLVDALFGAGREGLRDIYAAVLKTIKPLANARPLPCKTYIPLYNRVQFALLKPTGRDRLDLYLALGKDVPAHDRLEPIKPDGSRMSHRVRISIPKDVDREVKSWLKQAHARAGSATRGH